MTSNAGNTEESFCFECRFRSEPDIMELYFRTADETEWRMEEEWLTAKQKPNCYLQRLIFIKENNHERGYSIKVKITSMVKQAPGMIKVSEMKLKDIRTKICIPLKEFRIFEYGCPTLTKKHGAEVDKQVFADTFIYKVTIISTNESDYGAPRKDKLTIFSSNIHSLLETGNFSDAILSDDEGNHIKAHRNILSVRSTVFSAMFESNMIEKKDGIVRITDININILREMLRYVYSGMLRLVDTATTIELFAAADKYDLQHLKTLCDGKLRRHLSAVSAAKTLILAHLHCAEDLFEICMDYMARNFDHVRLSYDWKVLQKKYPELIRKIEIRRQAI